MAYTLNRGVNVFENNIPTDVGGLSTHIVSSANPAPYDGITKTLGQTGVYVHSTFSFEVQFLWINGNSGNWHTYTTVDVNNPDYTGGVVIPWEAQGTPPSAGVITAIFFKTTGVATGESFRIIPMTSDILVDGTPSDVTITTDTLVAGNGSSVLNTVLAQGPQGPAGADGADGAAGADGADGAAGADGATGAQGPAGADGVDGTSGDMGGTMTTHIIPDTNAVYDLGNAEYKIRHLFLSDNSMYIGDTWIKAEGDQIKTPNLLVGDINLNNEGRSNEVDGTSGHWSIQEGTDDLFLINRKTGKKFKFNITEV